MLHRQTALAPIRNAQGRFSNLLSERESFSGFTRKVAEDRHMSRTFAPCHCIPFATPRAAAIHWAEAQRKALETGGAR